MLKKVAIVLLSVPIIVCAGEDEGQEDAGPDDCGDREVCWNGIDDDCDGEQDEGCRDIVCDLGETRPCGGSPEVAVCVETCRGHEWGPCEPTNPGGEECGNHLDDNCDGRIDENCEG